jgi:drug/metabolite transporter (DMT)-like permease
LLAARNAQTELAVHRTLSVGDILLGNALSLGAALLFALYGVANKRLGRRYSPPELMCYTLIIGTLALAPVGIPALLSQNWSTVTWRTWLIIPYSVAFPIYITYTIWNWAIAQRGVGYVTLYAYLVPVLGGIFGFLLLGEALAPLQLVAGALVLGGMLVARHAATRVEKRAKPHALPAARQESPHPADAPRPVELFE